GFRKSREGSVTLIQHGSNDTTLKVSMTAFYRAHLEPRGVEHGDKFALTGGNDGLLVARLPRAAVAS
ncbi:MAG TPA: hypothetical protein VEG34_14985, partial [Thermoanaerobaculia bacterium]|nr:hypothetical protein [Thermoanaerobaculia bacterium]